MVFTVVILFFLVCMISSPAKFIGKALEGISAWATAVLPSVLPFMFFTRVLSSLNQMEKLTRPFSGISRALFKTPPISIYAFAMAILSGYPVGSKMVADLFLQEKITREDAFKMTAFCSTSGPMFIVGAVGIGMFHNSKIGYVLFLSHVLGAILNGMAWRKFKLKQTSTATEDLTDEIDLSQNTKALSSKQQNSTFNLSDIVLNSTLAILSVGCIITVFFIIIECFNPLLSLLPTPIAYFLQGSIEITKGCLSLATLENSFLATTLCSFVVSFGGISTVLQSITMLQSVKMPTKIFIFQKLTHAIFATLTTLLILILI